jgi:hypothetical protein
MGLLVNQCDVESWDNGNINAEDMLPAEFHKRSALSQNLTEGPHSALMDCENAGSTSDTVTGNSLSVSPFLHLSSPQKKPCFRTAEGGLPEWDDTDCRTRGSLGPLLSSSMAAKDCREHSSHEWELRKEEIKQLYVIEDKPLKEVVGIMRDRGFVAKYVFLISSCLVSIPLNHVQRAAIQDQDKNMEVSKEYQVARDGGNNKGGSLMEDR